jgi:hypothetical protein
VTETIRGCTGLRAGLALKTEHDCTRKSSSGVRRPSVSKTSAPKFSAAVQLRCAIIGITSGSRLLPRELVNFAEHQIVVPPLDGRPPATVIETVTGTRPLAKALQREP